MHIAYPPLHIIDHCLFIAIMLRKSFAFHIIIGTLVSWTLSIALVLILDDTPSRHAQLPDDLRPFRPFGIRVINALGILLDQVGLLDQVVSLHPDRLLSSACSKLSTEHSKTCVLFDNNNKRWEESFHLLTHSLQTANLTMLGRVIAQNQVIDMLETRGKLLEEFARAEKKEDSSLLHDPIFIVGLPRTGTTFLSRLLDVDPQNRGPLLWEYMDPVPRPPPRPPSSSSQAVQENYQTQTKDRSAEQQWKLDQYKQLSPGLDFIHPMNATAPEECLIVLNYAMDSEQVALTYPIHDYMQYLLGYDHHLDALQLHKKVLQHLQQDDLYGPRRWVLKTPYYLAMLDDIRAVHPNAKVIHTHRDPQQSMVSTSSLIAKLHSVVSDDIDLFRIASEQVQIYEQMAEMALRVRKKWDFSIQEEEDSFRVIDVHLQDLQENAIETVQMIYKSLFDSELENDTKRLMQEWLERNPRKIRNPTTFHFGLERLVETSTIFRDYRDAFSTKGTASKK